ncbi:hypothetical protein [Demequina subtropica]|uniref:hypothetical protein n=1 Tax=Demequina subtropica TaxID=1638989 RepID=UPI000785894B|nr:hypothetical protein [Demequina subtropica]
MHSYSLVFASFVGERDGVALELHDDFGEVVAEVFQPDGSQRGEFRMAHDAAMPFEVVEWFLAQSKAHLGISTTGNTSRPD